MECSAPPDSVWLEHAYFKNHPVLADWIGKNMQVKLRFPDKKDPNKWSVCREADCTICTLTRIEEQTDAAQTRGNAGGNGCDTTSC